jgi:phosphatidylserine decarboxylase
MPLRRLLLGMLQRPALNFALTSRIPRVLATHLAGRISRSEHALVRGVSMRVWTFFAGDLALHEAKKTRFASMHECFIRELKEGARPVDSTAGLLVSPCDGILGACGAIEGTQVFQAKGRSYLLGELLHDDGLVARHADGCYVTLRLTSTMYHRFHAPDDCEVDGVTHVPGDVWNVNPAALERVDRLFCRNERAVVPLRLAASTAAVTMVPVAAVLVAGIHLHCVGSTLQSTGTHASRIACRASMRRGEEMGYFEHGSTILVFGSRELALVDTVRTGTVIRMGQPLFRYI